MAAPDILIPKNQILLKYQASILGIELPDSPFLFGNVEKVNEFSDNYEVGDDVMFDPKGATIMKYSSVDYYLVDEKKVFFKEVTPP